MVQEKGKRSFSKANEANIPVNIFLSKTEDDEGNEDGTWTLTANNFMPDRADTDGICQDVYEAISENKAELVAVIQRHILPLYKKAVDILQAICGGQADDLYFWQ